MPIWPDAEVLVVSSRAILTELLHIVCLVHWPCFVEAVGISLELLRFYHVYLEFVSFRWYFIQICSAECVCSRSFKILSTECITEAVEICLKSKYYQFGDRNY